MFLQRKNLSNIWKISLRWGVLSIVFHINLKHRLTWNFIRLCFLRRAKKGLEVLKDTLWKVFGGKFYHKNKKEFEDSQLSLFTEDDEKSWLLNLHAEVAKELLLAHNNETMSYSEIEVLLIERSMLTESQILSNVLKPLIEEGKVIKMNLATTKRNFKSDSYRII